MLFARQLTMWALFALLCVPSLEARTTHPKPCNPKASAEARALLARLYKTVDDGQIISGLHHNQLSMPNYTRDLDRIAAASGQEPLIWGGDVAWDAQRVVELATEQYNTGHIITLMWHAARPMDHGPVNFRKQTQGKMTDQQWRDLITEGSEMQRQWLAQVDSVAQFLKVLRDRHIPVLWRPYHEMNGEWFWWGNRPGPDGYQRLWRMLYDRMVHYHGLNNLIWVWNANAERGGRGAEPMRLEKYYPGPDCVDVLATDVYHSDWRQCHHDRLDSLAHGKLIALGELGPLPSPEQLKQMPRFAWFMVWTDFAGQRYNSLERLHDIFALPNVINYGQRDGNDGRVLRLDTVPVMETGGQTMPNAWIDRQTGHRVIRLTRRPGSNRSFYFHNHPFIGHEMLFVGADDAQASSDMVNGSTAGTRKQMYAVDLHTLAIRQVTDLPYSVSTEIVCPATREIFFQRHDSVFAHSTVAGVKEPLRFVARMPRGGHIVCVNCDGTRLAGTFNNPEEGRILREHPKKSEFFSLIYEAKLEKTIFTINTATGEFCDVWTDHAWLNHLQFSPTDPNRLLFCHEGHWHKVDRIWNIDIRSAEELAAAGLSDRPVRQPVLMHKRTTPGEYTDAEGKVRPGEIAGHEWFGADGKHVYFDLQRPRGYKFYVGKVDVETLEESDYAITGDEWAVHFTTSWDERFLVGDGGSPTSVAHSDKDQWIYRYDYRVASADEPEHQASDSLRTEKLVNMERHNYNLEPNVHVSPDQRWVIFRANFEGYDNVYAVVL